MYRAAEKTRTAGRQPQTGQPVGKKISAQPVGKKSWLTGRQKLSINRSAKNQD